MSQSRRNAITRAVADVSPAVVGINVTQIQRVVSSPFDDPFFRMFFEPQEMTERVQGLGSGFLISQDGYILTNEHVVHEASKIIVTTTDGKQYTARLVGSDFLFDIALLKIEGTRFPFIPLGDSRDILIGEWVIALGNPFGLFDVNSKPTVTVGVVSATGMNFKGELRIEGRSYGDMIQTDAAINGGNSGGPLVNSLGECIGINAFIISGSNYEKTSIGIGFAIPIHRVKAILPALKAVGRVERESWTGIRIRALSATEARRLGISSRDGVLIESIRPGSPAGRSDLRPGDVLVAVNQKPVRGADVVRDFTELFDPDAVTPVDLGIFRNGRLYRLVLSPKPEER
ncbi:MAG: trypsin-like peptidase domain-containing protein [bacterium]|nr:trypsin-like peptidase domain-containing protein [bacterium]